MKFFNETDIINEFNKKLLENSDFVLPEGYKKIQETSLKENN